MRCVHPLLRPYQIRMRVQVIVHVPNPAVKPLLEAGLSDGHGEVVSVPEDASGDLSGFRRPPRAMI